MDWTAIIVAIFTSTAFSTLVQGIIKIFEKKKNRKDAYASGIRIVLYSQLKHDAIEYKKDEAITRTEYEAFMEGYAAYKALGGDGYMEKIKKEIENLPIILDR